MINSLNAPFYHADEDSLIKALDTSTKGLSSDAASKRLKAYGYNRIDSSKRTNSLLIFLNQFKSPITIILIASAILSFFLGEKTDAIIIIMIGAILGFLQKIIVKKYFKNMRNLFFIQ